MHSQPIQFRLAAAGFAIAALYHLAALTVPAFARAAYLPAYPASRHIVFIIVDAACAYLMLLRPWWFLLVYFVLTMQVLAGHGARLWRTRSLQQRVSWIDLIVVLGTLLGLAFLYFDRRARGRRRG